MCLLIFSHRVCRDYPLILAANRDEFYARKTAPSTFWPDHPELLAGRDLEAGGTWMGLTRQGRFAAITNYRDPAVTVDAPHSRGALPLDFLTGSNTAEDYLQLIAAKPNDYAGFNLLLGDGEDLWYFSNRPQAQGRSASPPLKLQPGIYGLSNASLNTPWAKVELGKSGMRMQLDNAPPNHDDLLSLVSNRQQANLKELQLTGRDGTMEQILSAQFILAGEYGTRSTTTLWIDRTGAASWRELTFDRLGGIVGVVEEGFEA